MKKVTIMNFKLKGFTLIELLIVIAIIGIVAAIAIPNLLTALQKGKLKSTMGDMRNIATAVEGYMADNAMAPGAGMINTVGGLNPYLSPFHCKILPQKDGWNENLRYVSGVPGPTQEEYSIISYGKNRTANAMNVLNNGYLINSMQDFENDICYSNGFFTYAPKIK
jgi:prepilin-type N-terminal cleavage/methylation domain-containing protein